MCSVDVRKSDVVIEGRDRGPLASGRQTLVLEDAVKIGSTAPSRVPIRGGMR